MSYVEIDNNRAQNAMRGVALGRKNWLQIGSESAVPKVAALLSVLESCKRIGVNVREYLLGVLPQLSYKACARKCRGSARWRSSRRRDGSVRGLGTPGPPGSPSRERPASARGWLCGLGLGLWGRNRITWSECQTPAPPGRVYLAGRIQSSHGFSALEPNPVPPQELLGSETVNPFKGAREMEGIGEIQLLGHLLHHQPAIEQEFRRAVEPEPEKKLIGGGVRETPEKAAEIRQLHMTGGGHRLHRFDLNIVFLHPLLGALVTRVPQLKRPFR